MTRCYLDANYLYVHLRQPRRTPDPRVVDWRRRLVAELAGFSLDGGTAAYQRGDASECA